ncbi:MAG: peptidoglycan bridge formation glycyltransferase FemA/FemB family protein [Cyanobacteria bacterium]|nr:peptidoglycan bridge formation glycyltransferase FemA/FemB family protein [Cyanobacteriota bacterium]
MHQRHLPTNPPAEPGKRIRCTNDLSRPVVPVRGAGFVVRNITELELNSPIARAWESLVCANRASGLMQSLYWSRFKTRMGLRPVHFGLFRDDTLIGGALFYRSSSNRPAAILVAPEGPVLPWDDAPVAEEGMRLLMQAAREYATSNNIIAVRIEPRIEEPLSSSVQNALRGFGRAPVNLIPKETLYLNLSSTEEELLNSMTPKGRYNIRLSQRHGIAVRAESSPEAVRHFYQLLLEASRRDDFAVEPPKFFEDLLDTLCEPGHARVLLAEKDGDILAAMLLTTYGARATYLYGGISNRRRNLMAGYALQWEAVRISRDLGCSVYDMYGFDQFGSPQNNYARFSQFKRRFGGSVARFIGAHDFFFTERLAAAVIQAIKEINPADAQTPSSF